MDAPLNVALDIHTIWWRRRWIIRRRWRVVAVGEGESERGE